MPYTVNRIVDPERVTQLPESAILLPIFKEEETILNVSYCPGTCEGDENNLCPCDDKIPPLKRLGALSYDVYGVLVTGYSYKDDNQWYLIPPVSNLDTKESTCAVQATPESYAKAITNPFLNVEHATSAIEWAFEHCNEPSDPSSYSLQT